MKLNIVKSFSLAVIIAVIIVSSVIVSIAQAETVGYWRFESEANFLEDSGPNNLDLTANGTTPPNYLALSSSGDGSDFSDPIPQTGQANDGAADFTTAGGNFSHADNSLFALCDFTIEALFNRDNNDAHMFLISQYASGDRSWGLGIRNSSSNHYPFVYICESGATSYYRQAIGVGMRASELDHDYYVAVSFDASDTDSGVTFYLQDLTAGTPMNVYTVDHTSDSLFDSSADVVIGSKADGGYDFFGVLDEVRLSNCELSQSELLVSVPEPGVVVLLCSMMLGVFMFRRMS